MSKKIIDFYLKSIGKEGLVMPQIIENAEFLTRLDNVLQNGNPYMISFLFRHYGKDALTTTGEKLINTGLDKPRTLHADEQVLIDNIVNSYKTLKHKLVIFSSVGNLIYVCEVVDSIKAKRTLGDILKITCFLWLYQNIVEIILSHLSELFYMIALEANDKNFLKLYTKAVSKDEHLMYGNLRSYAIKKGFTAESKKTFLHENEIRNRIAHANCFYDSVRKKIILDNTKNITIEEFFKEFEKVRNFLFELIYQLNDKNKFNFKKEMLKMGKEYQKLGRSYGKASNRIREIVNKK